MSSQREIADFLRNLDAPDATATTPIAAQPDGATIPPAATEPKPGEVPSTPQGPIPFDVHTKALENARTKAVDGFRGQYGITPQVTPEVFQKGIGFARAIDQNPIEFMNQLAANIANHPVWGPQLRSSAGRTLATPAPQGPPGPDIEVTDANGRVVSMTFSDKRTAEREEFFRNQLKGEFSQMIQPFQQERKDRLDKEQQDALKAEADAYVAADLARVNDILDGRTDLGPKVAELMAQGVHQIDAAIRVRKEFITPTVARAAEAAVLDTQLKKVAGNTVTGSGTLASKPKIGPNSTQKELAAFLRDSDQASA